MGSERRERKTYTWRFPRQSNYRARAMEWNCCSAIVVSWQKNLHARLRRPQSRHRLDGSSIPNSLPRHKLDWSSIPNSLPATSVEFCGWWETSNYPKFDVINGKLPRWSHHAIARGRGGREGRQQRNFGRPRARRCATVS